MQSRKLTRRAGATEVVHQVVTSTAILTRIAFTVVHVQLAILSLETGRTDATVTAHQVLTRCAVLTGRRVALIDLDRAVAAGVAVVAVASMTVADILASSVVTQ